MGRRISDWCLRKRFQVQDFYEDFLWRRKAFLQRFNLQMNSCTQGVSHGCCITVCTLGICDNHTLLLQYTKSYEWIFNLLHQYFVHARFPIQRHIILLCSCQMVRMRVSVSSSFHFHNLIFHVVTCLGVLLPWCNCFRLQINSWTILSINMLLII